jgi:hypothetical protein
MFEFLIIHEILTTYNGQRAKAKTQRFGSGAYQGRKSLWKNRIGKTIS